MEADSSKKNNLLLKLRGRGAEQNATGRYESIWREADLSDIGHIEAEDLKVLETEFFRDSSRTIVNRNTSPDIPFEYSINPYRGCEHGCAYCYARPTHEYLGLSAGLDFESKIFVKEDAPELLHEKLMSPSWKPSVISISGVTDCYQPAERKYELTRGCLEVLLKFKNPVGLITKNELITRDLDILKALAEDDLVTTFISVTTLDPVLGRELEPRTSSPQARLRAIHLLSKSGVPVGVNVAPVIPGLTDHELPHILKAASEAGASSAGYVPLRLPYSVKDIFSDWLKTHRPERAERVLSSIRDIRSGELNSAEFGNRMRGDGARADSIEKMFKIFSEKYGLAKKDLHLRTDLFRRPGDQLNLF